MSHWQRPMGIWELFAGLRAILETAGIPPPPTTPEMETMAYARLRSGLDYRTVRAMLWVESDDNRLWLRKSRGPVLRLWHALKQDLWGEQHRREDEAPSASAWPASWDAVVGETATADEPDRE